MAPLDHWHPVLQERALGSTPRRLLVCGEEVVLFRTASGRVGALQHECPHRRMPLSEGRVRGESLVCAYHGWRYTPEGNASCPSMPNARLAITRFDVAVHEGAIWLKNVNSNAALPTFDVAGMPPVCQLQVLFRAPLELVADNLGEMEHTGEAHVYIGYDTDRMHEVTVASDVGDDYVRVVASGPQRRLPLFMNAARRLSGAARDDLFVFDLTFRFSPVHVISDAYWVARRSGERRRDGLHARLFLVPRSESETDVYGFYYQPRGGTKASRLFRPLLERLIRLELECDRRVTEKVADRDPRLDGLQLGRFDQPLLAVRERIARHYGVLARGNAAAASVSKTNGSAPIESLTRPI